MLHCLTLECVSYNFSTIIYVRPSLRVHVLHIASHKMVTSSESPRTLGSNAQQPAITGCSLFLQVYHVLPTATTAHACLHAQRPAATSPAPLSVNHLVLKAVNVSLAMFLVMMRVCVTNNVAAHTLTDIMRYSLCGSDSSRSTKQYLLLLNIFTITSFSSACNFVLEKKRNCLIKFWSLLGGMSVDCLVCL